MKLPELSTTSYVARTRTPSALKWLLNERAALAGKAEKTRRRIGRLEEMVAARESTLAGAKATLAEAQRGHQETLSTLQALDITLELAHKNVRPDAAGIVCAWAGKYGKRGALKAFIARALREAAPRALTTSSIGAAATQHFGLQLETPDEKRAFRDTVRGSLRQLRDVDCKVESLHERRSGSPSAIWRWKSALTLADLASISARQEAPCEQDEDASRGEMAPE